MGDPIRVQVEGLRDTLRDLKALDADAAKAMSQTTVAKQVRMKVPKDTGAAAGSYKARGGAKGASLAFGGAKAPYAPWLDFGGKLPQGGNRPRVKGGRYLYPTIESNLEDVADQVAKALEDLNGLDVEGG